MKNKKISPNFKSRIYYQFQLLALVCLVLTTVISSPAQTLTTLATFTGANGGNPELMTLAQGLDGNFYGTTKFGGASDKGVVFKVTSLGALSVMHSFSGISPEGEFPVAGLLLSTTGNFYGTTEQGGTGAAGTVFHISSAGVFAIVHGFDGVHGLFPDAPLIQVGGLYYGTTQAGGSSNDGVAYSISGGGVLTVKHNFLGEPDGATPRAPLLYAADGNFYGTTELGGAMGTSGGSVFKMTTAGVESVPQSFPNGYDPYGGLVQGPDGSFYGTTNMGGLFNAGTIFKMSADGKTLTKLHDFGVGTNDGAFPYAGLTLASDGFLYGTTAGGLGHGNEFGTIFRIALDGTKYKNLYQFKNTTDGMFPTGGLLQGTDGNFYGTTDRGGHDSSACQDGGSCGVVFKFSVGAPAFVKALPIRAFPGAVIKILGNNLLGTTSVKFNGTAAVFHIISATELTATVPVGATSGNITVTTPSGTLSTIVPFKVL